MERRQWLEAEKEELQMDLEGAEAEKQILEEEKEVAEAERDEALEQLAAAGIDTDNIGAVGEDSEERTKKLVQQKFELTSALKKLLADQAKAAALAEAQVAEIEQLRIEAEQVGPLQERCNQFGDAIQELKEQLDAALAMEDMVAELQEKKLEMDEECKEFNN